MKYPSIYLSIYLSINLSIYLFQDIVVSMSHKAITSLIFTSTPPITVSPLQYTVSLQPGLSYWTDKLIELHDDQSHWYTINSVLNIYYCIL